MTKKITSILMANTILLTTSCASIVSKTSYPISINSSPSEANITVTDKKGIEVYVGNTPANLSLKSGAGFFSKARYQVEFSKPGYDKRVVPVEYKIDGWYFGNLVFGGFIGFLIVDPASGAMYKLETKFINETLTQSTASIEGENEGLQIYSLDEIPNDWKNHLVSIKK